jgi:hypothetical protein
VRKCRLTDSGKGLDLAYGWASQAALLFRRCESATADVAKHRTIDAKSKNAEKVEVPVGALYIYNEEARIIAHRETLQESEKRRLGGRRYIHWARALPVVSRNRKG